VPTTTPGAGGADPFEQARLAARELARLTGVDHHDVVVVLGTGLAPVAAALGAQDPSVDLTNLPWFTRFSGPGHRPEAWSVQHSGQRVLVVAGRLHLYEGVSPAEVVHLVRTAVAAGARTVILTCSAGAINPDYQVGQVLAIADHLNMTGQSPLSGLAPHAGGASRHLDQTYLWSPRLRGLARQVTPSMAEGVYAQMPGPEFETPAEIRVLHNLGADLVGMSTVPEAIAARHLGAEVLGLSVVTNAAAGAASADLSEGDIVAAAQRSAGTVARLIGGVLQLLAPEVPGA
jgi:purine-nucleoside phosphorylase